MCTREKGLVYIVCTCVQICTYPSEYGGKLTGTSRLAIALCVSMEAPLATSVNARVSSFDDTLSYALKLSHITLKEEQHRVIELV